MIVFKFFILISTFLYFYIRKKKLFNIKNNFNIKKLNRKQYFFNIILN